MKSEKICRPLRKCPVCSGESAELLVPMDYCGDNGLPLHYDIVCCNSCSMVYNDFAATQADFDAYYRQCGKYSDADQLGGGGLSPEEAAVWERYRELLESYLHPDMAILEIGCGKGGFLQTLKKYGFHNLWAVEPSAGCVEQLNRNGIRAFPDWENLRERKFDIIISNAVLEHLVEPRKMMELFQRQLTADGILMLGVPDAGSYCRYTGAPFYYFDREHINHFTVDSLKLLCAMYSFEPQCLHIAENPTVGMMKFHYDIVGIFKKQFSASSSAIRRYVAECSTEKNVVPEELFRYRQVFLWGIGAYAENLLRSGFFDRCENIHLLDKNSAKQAEIIAGKKVHPPEYLLNFPSSESVVLITSVLYQNMIIAELKAMGFSGKYLTLNH